MSTLQIFLQYLRGAGEEVIYHHYKEKRSILEMRSSLVVFLGKQQNSAILGAIFIDLFDGSFKKNNIFLENNT